MDSVMKSAEILEKLYKTREEINTVILKIERDVFFNNLEKELEKEIKVLDEMDEMEKRDVVEDKKDLEYYLNEIEKNGINKINRLYKKISEYILDINIDYESYFMLKKVNKKSFVRLLRYFTKDYNHYNNVIIDMIKDNI